VPDVEATLPRARRLRAAHPRLFDWFFALRRKQRAFELLDWARRTPVLHVSSRYPAQRGCLAMVMPLAVHPQQPNKVIVCDLDTDPAALLDLDADEIADRVFTPRADLPEDVERIPLKAVSANRAPALAPLTVLAGTDVARIGLDVERCMRHAGRLQAAAGLSEKVATVFAASSTATEPPGDVDLALYRGFLGDADRRRLRDVRGTPPHELGTRAFGFSDPRCAELLFRYRARNYPATLSLAESARWQQHCRDRLTRSGDATALTLDDFFREIALLRATADARQGAILDALEQWGRELP
jgi:exodeoxyribonuclease-1